MRKSNIFFGISLAVIMITGSFQLPAFAEDLPFSVKEIKTNPNTASFVPGQLIVGLEKPDSHFNEKASIYGGHVINSIDQINAHVVKVPINSEEKFIESMLKNPNVLYVEHDVLVNAFDIPNDPLYQFQWGTQRIGMESAWSANFDEGSGTIIAVLDEGVYDHTDFFGVNIMYGQDWDFADNDDNTIPDKNCFTFTGTGFQYVPEAHGTWVTGVIASAINDNWGLAGVGNFDILPIKVLDECGGGFASNVAAGIIYATDAGADVINLSLGAVNWPNGEDDLNTMHNAVKYATAFPAEVVVVAAAGNDGTNDTAYPAGFAEVISVGATTIDDTIASYSQHGPTLDLSGPGASGEGTCDSANGVTYILTTGVDTTGVDNGNGNTSPTNPSWEYSCVAGTSFAAPYVSAVAGLVKSQNPGAFHEDIQCHLEKTSEDLGSTGWDQYFGHGLVRADIALSTSLIPSSQCELEDLPPVITLTGDNPQLIEAAPLPSIYTELGATAIDDLDGDISGNIVIDETAVNTSVPEIYVVTYDVMDSSENPATQVVRTVTVQDSTAPVVSLIGDSPQVIEVDTTYSELGATASDTLDGDITGSIVIDSSDVDTSIPGDYVVTYDVMDLAGNVATQVVRTVTVEDTTPVDPNTIHVGDLNWTASNKKNWNAKVFITVHDKDELPVSGVVVQGTFTGGGITPVNCTTDDLGKCQVSKSTRLTELIFSVVGLSASDYVSSDTHHDPDPDFTGEPIVTIFKGDSSIGSEDGDGGSEPNCPPAKEAKGKC